MFRKIIVFVSILVVAALAISTSPVRAETQTRPVGESNAYDLINAVNALRAAYGLPAYSISPILMFTAQNQSDFMAATGTVTHSGPSGSTYTQRLLAAGYPLAGDLSLGGFRSENIISGSTSFLADDAVNAWMGDAPHQNTMLSQNLTEIGAGVTVVNGRVYYVIDCARPTTAGDAPAGTQAVGTEAGVPVAEAGIVIPVTVSTAGPGGEVIHEVLAGQSLWALAIAYGVKIDEIKRLNNLFGNDIYPGDRLLIKYEATPAPALSTSTQIAPATMTLPPTAISITASSAPTTTPVVKAAKAGNGVVYVIAIIVVAMLGAGVFAMAGNARVRDE